MTVQRMRQHIGAGIWHFKEAVFEAPDEAALPPALRTLMLDQRVVNLNGFGIDGGYIREAADRETHLLPEEVRQGKTQ